MPRFNYRRRNKPVGNDWTVVICHRQATLFARIAGRDSEDGYYVVVGSRGQIHRLDYELFHAIYQKR